MPIPSEQHPSDDEIELYALGRLAEARVSTLEEHLLICEPCRARLEEMDEYVAAMRQALGEVKESKREARPGLLTWLFTVPKPVWAGAAAAAALALFFIPLNRFKEPYDVQLRSFRGDSGSLIQKAPAHTPLLLSVDTTGLPEYDRYWVEVADSGGRGIFESVIEAGGERQPIRIDRSLDSGQYWVRLYSPKGSPGEEGLLLREFGLRLE